MFIACASHHTHHTGGRNYRNYLSCGYSTCMSRRARAAAPPALRITYMCIHTSARYRFRDTASQGHRDSPYNVKTLCSRLTLSSAFVIFTRACCVTSLTQISAVAFTCAICIPPCDDPAFAVAGSSWVVPEPRSAQRHHTTAMRITMRRRAPPPRPYRRRSRPSTAAVRRWPPMATHRRRQSLHRRRCMLAQWVPGPR